MAERVSAQDLAGLEAGTDPAVVLNLIERLMARVQALEEELGRARDEINRLKGEQRRPGGLTKKRQRVDHSSERGRREAAKTWHKGAKLPPDCDRPAGGVPAGSGRPARGRSAQGSCRDHGAGCGA